MKVRIIKGTNQIGGCITEITCNNSKIIIDFGEDLDDKNETFELEGLTYGDSIYDAVFITHSHGDHIGLIDNINEDIPVYVEKESLTIQNLTSDFCNKDRVKRKINTFEIPYNLKRNEDNRIIFENKDLKVSVYSADHSSYNSCMFLIEGNGKRILHTGDFRNHGRRKVYFEISLNKIGKIDMLIAEGTTLTRFTKDECKFLAEKDLEKKAYDIMDKYNQVFVLQSSTNIDRTVSMGRAALRDGKKFILDLFSYYLNENSTHYFNVDNKNVFVWKPYKYKYKPDWFKDKYLNIKTSYKMFPDFAMEVKESMLPDIKMLFEKGLLTNACLIYSMWNGYIKKDDKVKFFLEEIKEMGIDVVELHTSGHADLRGMKMVNNKLKPNQTIIIHTENNESGKNIYNNVISVKDGDYIEIN